jgi:hypothetical protein
MLKQLFSYACDNITADNDEFSMDASFNKRNIQNEGIIDKYNEFYFQK